MRQVSVVALAVVLALCGVSETRAGGSPRAHDGGFFLRLSAGLGSASTSIDDPFGELDFSGLSGDVNFAVGAIVSDNLALHGTLWGWSVADPDVEIDGVEFGELDGSVNFNAIGGGVTYYLMPSNIYFSGSAGIGWVEFDADILDEESDAGFALDATVGKEWWVGNSWGLGVAGAVGYHSVPIDGTDENLSGVSFGVRFSATLN